MSSTPFILDDKAFLQKINSVSELTKEYEGRTGAKLNNPSPSSFYKSVGYHNTEMRSKQINALVWLHHHFHDHLNYKLPENFKKGKSDLEIVQEIQNRRLMALRVLTGACIHIMETNKSGKLKEMLEESLGINTVNKLDPESRAYCLNAVHDYFNQINGNTRQYGSYDLHGIDFTYFAGFYDFAKEELIKCQSTFGTFPFARILSVSFAWPASLVGYSIGALVGEAVSRSTGMQNTQWTITAAVGSFIYMVMGPTAGITLLAPTIASKAVTNVMGLSSAYVMGKTFEYTGQLIGALLGLPLDLILKFARLTASAALDMATSKGSDKIPNEGVSLINGQWYSSGQLIEAKKLSLEEMEKLEVVQEIDPNMLNESELVKEIKSKISERLATKKPTETLETETSEKVTKETSVPESETPQLV
ncbi:hypothetical protein [Legionella sp. W05-934-2]|jgi:hypothetical protein|uniref:hypothetical protein n=1 Tax=Legionella sp. W05-934-2 TaxID=1198649 RepID=UPI003462B6EE